MYEEEFLVARNGVSGISGGQKWGQWDVWWPEMGSAGLLVARNGVSRISGGQEWGLPDFWWPEIGYEPQYCGTPRMSISVFNSKGAQATVACLVTN